MVHPLFLILPAARGHRYRRHAAWVTAWPRSDGGGLRGRHGSSARVHRRGGIPRARGYSLVVAASWSA